MPNIRDNFPTGSRPKTIEIAELSQHLRVAILKMNSHELDTFTDALAAAFIANDDMRRLARFVVAKNHSDRGGVSDA